MDKHIKNLEEDIDLANNRIIKVFEKIKMGMLNFPMLTLYDSIVELSEAIVKLHENNSILPSKLILRSLIENYISLKFILYDVNLIENRSISYIYFSIKDSGDYYKDSYKFFNIKLEHLKTEDALKSIENLYPYIKKKFSDREAEMRKRKTRIKWYSLYDDIYNLKWLSKYLGEEALYTVYYSLLSRDVHATDTFKKLIIASEGIELTRGETAEHINVVNLVNHILNSSGTLILTELNKYFQHDLNLLEDLKNKNNFNKDDLNRYFSNKKTSRELKEYLKP